MRWHHSHLVVLPIIAGVLGLTGGRPATSKTGARHALDCEIDVEHRSVRSEFRRGQTHGIREYFVAGDSLTGRLVILPDKSIGREASARRAKEKEVPPAPPASAYEE